MRRFFVYVRGFVYVRSGGRNRRNIERMDGFEFLPGSGKTFEDFFELTLPTAEYITASMSMSGPLSKTRSPQARGTDPLDQTSTSSSAPFIPSGTFIEQDTVLPILRRTDGGPVSVRS